MKKIVKFIKKNLLGFLVGLSLCLNGVIIAGNMITSEQVSYSNSKTEETTVKGTLDQLFSAVDINERIGSTDISSIGNGTITDAINLINTNLENIGLNIYIDNVTKVSDRLYKSSFTITREGLYLITTRIRQINSNNSYSYIAMYHIDQTSGDPIAGGNSKAYQWVNFSYVEYLKVGTHYIYTYYDDIPEGVTVRANITLIG